MVNGKFSTPQLSLEYMERGLRTAIAIAEPVEQPVVVTAATNEVSSDIHSSPNLDCSPPFLAGLWTWHSD